MVALVINVVRELAVQVPFAPTESAVASDVDVDVEAVFESPCYWIAQQTCNSLILVAYARCSNELQPVFALTFVTDEYLPLNVLVRELSTAIRAKTLGCVQL